jgi:hypothetical protein
VVCAKCRAGVAASGSVRRPDPTFAALSRILSFPSVSSPADSSSPPPTAASGPATHPEPAVKNRGVVSPAPAPHHHGGTPLHPLLLLLPLPHPLPRPRSRPIRKFCSIASNRQPRFPDCVAIALCGSILRPISPNPTLVGTVLLFPGRCLCGCVLSHSQPLPTAINPTTILLRSSSTYVGLHSKDLDMP